MSTQPSAETKARAAFERHVRRSWHRSWREELTKINKHGFYTSWHLNDVWQGFQAGWRLRGRAHD